MDVVDYNTLFSHEVNFVPEVDIFCGCMVNFTQFTNNLIYSSNGGSKGIYLKIMGLNLAKDVRFFDQGPAYLHGCLY